MIYTNTVGRRDSQIVPGNAEVSRGEYVAATGYSSGELVLDYFGAKEVENNGTILHLNGERDTDAASFITLTEPTGISVREINQRNYAYVIIIAGVILAAGIVVLKKKFTK